MKKIVSLIIFGLCVVVSYAQTSCDTCARAYSESVLKPASQKNGQPITPAEHLNTMKKMDNKINSKVGDMNVQLNLKANQSTLSDTAFQLRNDLATKSEIQSIPSLAAFKDKVVAERSFAIGINNDFSSKTIAQVTGNLATSPNYANDGWYKFSFYTYKSGSVLNSLNDYSSTETLPITGLPANSGSNTPLYFTTVTPQNFNGTTAMRNGDYLMLLIINRQMVTWYTGTNDLATKKAIEMIRDSLANKASASDLTAEAAERVAGDNLTNGVKIIESATTNRTRIDQSSIVRLGDSLILVATDYENNSQDNSLTNIARKVSYDNGVTWSNIAIIPQFEGSMTVSYYIPSLTVVGSKLIMIYTKNENTTAENFKAESTDGGATWSNIVKVNGYTNSYYANASNVIFKKNNTLYFPFSEWKRGIDKSSQGGVYEGGFAYSEDNGTTWTVSPTVFVSPDSLCNEPYFFEKGDSTAFAWRSRSGFVFAKSTIDFQNWGNTHVVLQASNATSNVFKSNRNLYAVFNRVENGVYNGLPARKNLDIAVSIDTARTWRTIGTLSSSQTVSSIEPAVFVLPDKVLIIFSKSDVTYNSYHLVQSTLSKAALEALENSYAAASVTIPANNWVSTDITQTSTFVQIGLSSGDRTNRLMLYNNHATGAGLHVRQDGAGSIQTWATTGGAVVAQMFGTRRMTIGTTTATTTLNLGGVAGTDGIKFPDNSVQTTSFVSQIKSKTLSISSGGASNTIDLENAICIDVTLTGTVNADTYNLSFINAREGARVSISFEQSLGTQGDNSIVFNANFLKNDKTAIGTYLMANKMLDFVVKGGKLRATNL
jgi:BNR repeat-like domain